jgi:hypothetical protein
MGWLHYAHPRLFSREAQPASPLISPGEAGIRLGAQKVAYDGEALSLELLVRYSFPEAFLLQFQRMLDALTLVLEDVTGARAAVCNLLDPHKRYPILRGPNYVPATAPPSHDASFGGGWVSVPLRIPLAAPSWAGPSFFATVFLQQHLSNTIAVELPEATVSSTLGGAPLALLTEADVPEPVEDETPDDGRDDMLPPLAGTPAPAPGVPALTLGLRTPGPFGPDRPSPLDGLLALEPSELALGGPEAWLRSVFVVATRQDTQHSGLGHWLGDGVVFPDAGQKRMVGGNERIAFALPFDLAAMLGPLPPGTYYVQMSARQHRSAVVEVACG